MEKMSEENKQKHLGYFIINCQSVGFDIMTAELI